MVGVRVAVHSVHARSPTHILSWSKYFGAPLPLQPLLLTHISSDVFHDLFENQRNYSADVPLQRKSGGFMSEKRVKCTFVFLYFIFLNYYIILFFSHPCPHPPPQRYTFWWTNYVFHQVVLPFLDGSLEVTDRWVKFLIRHTFLLGK